MSTWWSLVHLVTGLIAGYIVTIFVVVGAAVSLSLIVVFPLAMLGIWLLFVVGHGMAVVERSRYRAFCDVDLTDPAPPLTATNIWRRFVARLRSASRWRELLYLLLRLPVSALVVGLTLFVWAGSIALVALPVYVDDLPEEVLARRVPLAAEGSVAAARERAEREMIVATLARNNGEVTAAAREMQVSRTTMWRLMKKHGISA